MIVLIPAYKPTEKLVELINALQSECDCNIIVVDDGSGKQYENIFKKVQECGCVVLQHLENLGKGQALKTGFKYIKCLNRKYKIVCADCDGQHLVKDITNISNNIPYDKECIILGSRKFDGKVPFRSRLGNTIMRVIFKKIVGVNIYDTQTGLRGFSTKTLDFLIGIEGQRFEYEINMLLEAVKHGIELQEIDIKTVYLEKNKHSNYRLIKDSIAIWTATHKKKYY